MNNYKVKYFSGDFQLGSNWNSEQWKKTISLSLTNSILITPPFLPKTEVKLMYNEDHIFGIFKVQDKFIRSVNREINSPVSNDSCIEFFFTPSLDISVGYFNLEINAGGTPLIRFQKRQNINKVAMDIEDIKSIKIAHSLPEVVEPEITEPTIWTVEFQIPLNMLEKYYNIVKPESGIKWRANFYKCGDETTNPHYLAWSNIESSNPNFHMPEYFGEIEFQ